MKIRPAFIFINLLVLLSVVSASAETLTTETDCTSVDYSAGFGPSRNQGNASFCGIFTAADLLAFKMNIAPPDRISVIDMAIQFYGNFLVWAKEYVKTHPNPTRQANIDRLEVADNVTDHGIMPGLSINGYRHLTSGICLESQAPSEGLKSDPNFLRKAVDSLDAENLLYLSQLQKLSKAFKNPNQDVFVQAELKSRYQQFLINAAARLDQQCSRRIPIPALKVRELDGSAEELVKQMNENMNNHQPTGIAYNVMATETLPLLNNVFSYLPLQANQISLNDNISDYQGHASIVVARKWNPQSHQCSYKIRNSYGSDCSIYAPKFASRCSNGSFWMDESDFRSLVSSLVWIN